MSLKDELASAQSKLADLEASARGLKNQNLADIIKSAHAKVTQALDHPDLEKADDTGQEPLPFDPTAGAPVNQQPQE